MRIDILTLFPDMFQAGLGDSIIARGVEKGILQINYINIRDFSENKHKKVDDYPFGGGRGLLMAFQPIHDAWRSITQDLSYRPHCIYLSPQGKVLNQEIAKRLSVCNHLILLCGHYEGIDERVIDEIVDEEISIGDYVLTGGELPAMVLTDCIGRLVPGVLPAEECVEFESHYNGLLEYPQYTRPSTINGRDVPEVLLSGNHGEIKKWRQQQSLLRTKSKRPDLLENRKEL